MDRANGDRARGRSGVPSWPGLTQARIVAAEQGASAVGTQHVLLALLRGPDDVARTALRSEGIHDASVREALSSIEGVGVRRAPTVADGLPVSDRVVAVLADAAGRADHEEPGRVDDRDVLTALLDSNDPSVAQLAVAYIGSRRRVLDALDRRHPSRPEV